jgi:hypothetical protein
MKHTYPPIFWWENMHSKAPSIHTIRLYEGLYVLFDFLSWDVANFGALNWNKHKCVLKEVRPWAQILLIVLSSAINIIGVTYLIIFIIKRIFF